MAFRSTGTSRGPWRAAFATAALVATCTLALAGADQPKAEPQPQQPAPQQPAQQQPAKDYEIKLSRPAKVGMKYDVRAEAAEREQMTITAGGQTSETDQGYGIRFEATVEVLAVNKEGEESKLACTIKNCTRITADGESELIPAGRVVTAEAPPKPGDDPTYSIDQDGVLGEEAKEALQLVLNPSEEDGTTDDLVFGTAERQTVGSSWKINGDALAKDAAQDGVVFDAKDVTGSMKLEGVEDVAGVPCLKLVGDMDVPKMSIAAESLPDGMTVEGGTLRARLSGMFPTDPAVGSLADSISLRMTLKMKGKDPNGGELVIESTRQRAVESRRTFHPEAGGPAQGDPAPGGEQKGDQKKDEPKKDEQKEDAVVPAPPPPAPEPGDRKARAIVLVAAAAEEREDGKAKKEGGDSAAVATEEPVYKIGRPSRDGIGKFYMGREIAQVMGHLGADWLERPEREEEEAPTKLVEMMDLKPTDVVADIGAGTGYFSFRIADVVTEGKVLAVDIQQEMLDLLTEAAEKKKVKNVETVLGETDDPKLPEGEVDVVLMVDAYHEFDHPREMMLGIMKGLRPGGRVVLVEYRGEDPEVPIKPLHKMTEAQAIKEMAAVGLVHKETLSDLPRQHVMIFEEPAGEEEDAESGGDSPDSPDSLAPAPASGQ